MNEQVNKAIEYYKKLYGGAVYSQTREIFERAYRIFEIAGDVSDFCLQSADENIVFGGFNRIIWDRCKNSFRANKSHCTDRFIDAVEQQGAKKYSTLPGPPSLKPTAVIEIDGDLLYPCRWCQGSGLDHMKPDYVCVDCGGTGWRGGQFYKNEE